MEHQQLQPDNLTHALQLCLSSDYTQRNQGLNFLNLVRNHTNYSAYLLQISSDINIQKEIQQIAAVQVKNFILKCWNIHEEENKHTEIPQIEKEQIKAHILNIIPHVQNRSCRKIYLQLIGFLLKHENEWRNFLPTVQNYLNSTDCIFFLSGIEIFYRMSRQYEFELELKREVYNNSFNSIFDFLEKYFEQYLQKLGCYFHTINLSNEVDMRELKIVYKILKIFYRSIQINLPVSLIGQFEKWMNFLSVLIQLNFEQNDSLSILNKFPGSVDEFNFVSKNILWKIKSTSMQIIYKIYEKYSDPSKISKKEKKLKEFVLTISQNYPEFFFNIFFYTLTQSKEKFILDEILCLIYQFFHLILNRANTYNTKLLQLLEGNLEKIIKEYLIVNNIHGPVELDLFKNNQAEFVYRQFDYGLQFTNKQDVIQQFLHKLCEIKQKKKSRPTYLDSVYSYLIYSLEFISNEIDNNNDSVYFILLKESCINLMESIYDAIVEYYTDNIQEVIAKFIVNDLRPTGMLHSLLSISAFVFVAKISSNINYKNPELVTHIAELCLSNLFASNYEENLAICVESALAIPSLLKSHQNVKEVFKDHIANIFNVFLKLNQRLDCNELIGSLEKLIGAYKDEVIEFSVELTKELVNSLDRHIKEESTDTEEKVNVNSLYDNQNNLLDNDDDDYDSDLSSSSSDESNTNSAFSFILKTINKLIQVASKKQPYDAFYQIESLVYPVLTWGLKSNENSIYKEMIDIIYSIVNSNVPRSNLMWSLYPDILKTLIVYENKKLNQFENNFNQQIQPGTGIDHLQEIITIILNFIIKDPDNFLSRNGINYLDITINVIPDIITVSRQNSDEVGCSYAVKIIVILLETYKEKLDYILKGILSFVISELKLATQIVYKSILFQTIALSFVYNPRLTNQILEEMNVTAHLFELWINLITQMKFDFEYRRSLMAFSSILLIDTSEINKIISENLGFILNKILYLCKQLDQIREKQKGKEEAEVSDDEDSEIEEKEIQFKSKTKNFKRQLKDFIVDDLDDDDEEDEDYNELEHSFEKDGGDFKTNLDMQDEFVYLKDVMVYLSQNNPDYYTHLLSLMSDDQKNELSNYIYKAELRIANKNNFSIL